jgi:hypothetical protein
VSRAHRTATSACAAPLALVVALALVVVLAVAGVGAQRGNAQPAPSPRAAAPFDLTGYWVSIVTQDWRWRMVTPAKGDYLGIPMTIESKKVADAWDPAKDEAAGEQCKSYGAPALMSVPGRVHITWQDDRALTVETDAGQQTRVLQFGGPQPSPDTPRVAPRSWQGVSVAQWQMSRANVPLLLRPTVRDAGNEAPSSGRYGSLRVVTTNLRPGYLRKNGVPYSANAVLTEHWDVFKRANGEEWLTITTEIEDPLYLREPRLIALPFKKEPNAAKWDPSPCSSRW